MSKRPKYKSLKDFLLGIPNDYGDPMPSYPPRKPNLRVRLYWAVYDFWYRLTHKRTPGSYVLGPEKFVGKMEPRRDLDVIGVDCADGIDQSVEFSGWKDAGFTIHWVKPGQAVQRKWWKRILDRLRPKQTRKINECSKVIP